MARSLTTENKESLLLSAFSKLIESSELQAARDEIEKKLISFIKNVKNTMIYTDILGSDHCPIGIEID